MELRFTQLVIGQWAKNDKIDYQLIGLNMDGTAWRYNATKQSWDAYSMDVSEVMVGDAQAR